VDIDSWRKPLLEDFLRRIRFRTSKYYQPEFKAPWGVSVQRSCPVFHIVTRGTCWLDVDGAPDPMKLSEGDYAFVLRGATHRMRSGPSAPVVDFFGLVKTYDSERERVLRAGGAGALASFVCGGAEFEDGGGPLLALLPPVLLVKGTKDGWLASMSQQIQG